MFAVRSWVLLESQAAFHDTDAIEFGKPLDIAQGLVGKSYLITASTSWTKKAATTS